LQNIIRRREGCAAPAARAAASPSHPPAHQHPVCEPLGLVAVLRRHLAPAGGARSPQREQAATRGRCLRRTATSGDGPRWRDVQVGSAHATPRTSGIAMPSQVEASCTKGSRPAAKHSSSAGSPAGGGGGRGGGGAQGDRGDVGAQRTRGGAACTRAHGVLPHAPCMGSFPSRLPPAMGPSAARRSTAQPHSRSTAQTPRGRPTTTLPSPHPLAPSPEKCAMSRNSTCA
jgi:hypothetical protein